MVEIPHLSHTTQGALWESWALDKGVFITYDASKIYTYIYSRDSVTGKLL